MNKINAVIWYNGYRWVVNIAIEEPAENVNGYQVAEVIMIEKSFQSLDMAIAYKADKINGYDKVGI